MDFLRTASLASIALAVALSGCSAGPDVTVANLSAIPLTNVVVSSGDDERLIGALGPGAKATVTLKLKGEAIARLSFDAGGRSFDSAGSAYVESSGGYEVAFNVQPSFTVATVVDIKGY